MQSKLTAYITLNYKESRISFDTAFIRKFLNNFHTSSYWCIRHFRIEDINIKSI